MASLKDEQPPFDRAICDAMVASVPEEWNVIELSIERAVGSTAVGELSHSLSSPNHRESPSPDDSLYEATYRLDELFQRHGSVFRRATYRVELLPNSWRYTADFTYDKSGKK